MADLTVHLVLFQVNFPPSWKVSQTSVRRKEKQWREKQTDNKRERKKKERKRLKMRIGLGSQKEWDFIWRLSQLIIRLYQILKRFSWTYSILQKEKITKRYRLVHARENSFYEATIKINLEAKFNQHLTDSLSGGDLFLRILPGQIKGDHSLLFHNIPKTSWFLKAQT